MLFPNLGLPFPNLGIPFPNLGLPFFNLGLPFCSMRVFVLECCKYKKNIPIVLIYSSALIGVPIGTRGGIYKSLIYFQN